MIDFQKVNNIKRVLLIICGFLSLLLGVVGIFLPLLPTTPFLLLTAACFFRSSKKFYDWLLNHKIFGVYIRNYREKKGIHIRHKIISLSLMWVMILYSAFFVIPIWIGRISLFITAIAVSWHILSMKTLRGK